MLPQFFNQIKNLLASLSLPRKITIFALAGLFMAGMIILIWGFDRTDYQILYSNLSPQDAGLIVNKLKEQKISYRLSPEGNTISVPKEQVYETRLQLATEGLPQGGGVGFEVFDRAKLGMTEFLQNVNYQRALQGELTRTINQLVEVEQSRVHLVIPKKSLFVEDREDPTASVVLKMGPGKTLQKEQIQGIINLVASSVEGLKPQNVTVVDIHGQILSRNKDSFPSTELSSSQLEFQQKLEKKLEQNIQTMLEKVVGENKIVTRVSALVDFQEVEKTEERYDPEYTVVRSKQRSEEENIGSSPIPSGVPGVMSNLPETKTFSANKNKSSNQKRQNEVVNYEVSKVTSRMKEPVGSIKRLSVAVLIDGTYQMVSTAAGKEEWTYRPRNPEEMEIYKNIVKTAIGYNEQRGDQIEVANIPFEKGEFKQEKVWGEEATKGEKREFLSIPWKFLLPLLFLFLFLLFISRLFLRWLSLRRSRQLDIVEGLPKTVRELEKEIEMREERKGELISREQKALELAKNDPGRTTKLVRHWLKEEERNSGR